MDAEDKVTAEELDDIAAVAFEVVSDLRKMGAKEVNVSLGQVHISATFDPTQSGHVGIRIVEGQQE